MATRYSTRPPETEEAALLSRVVCLHSQAWAHSPAWRVRTQASVAPEGTHQEGGRQLQCARSEDTQSIWGGTTATTSWVAALLKRACSPHMSSQHVTTHTSAVVCTLPKSLCQSVCAGSVSCCLLAVASSPAYRQAPCCSSARLVCLPTWLADCHVGIDIDLHPVRLLGALQGQLAARCSKGWLVPVDQALHLQTSTAPA